MLQINDIICIRIPNAIIIRNAVTDNTSNELPTNAIHNINVPIILIVRAKLILFSITILSKQSITNGNEKTAYTASPSTYLMSILYPFPFSVSICFRW